MQWPNDWHATEVLVETRRDAMAREIRRQALLAQLPEQPVWWRMWTGGSLLWLGARLTQWGERLTPPSCPHPTQVQWSQVE